MIRTMQRMRARPGAERAVESAWRTLAGQISGTAGNLRHDLLLNATDPRSLVAVTEWADPLALRRYENGPAAARFADEVRPLSDSAGVERYREVLDPDGNGSRIFVDVEINVPALRLGEFEQGYVEVVQRMGKIPGYVGEELLREPDSDVYHIFAEWRSESEFYQWIRNPAHAREEAGPIAPFLLDFRRRLFHIVTHL